MGRADRKAPQRQFIWGFPTKPGQRRLSRCEMDFFHLPSRVQLPEVSQNRNHSVCNQRPRSGPSSEASKCCQTQRQEKTNSTREGEWKRLARGKHRRRTRTAGRHQQLLGGYESNPSPHPNSQVPYTSLSPCDASGRSSSRAERCIAGGSGSLPHQ